MTEYDPQAELSAFSSPNAVPTAWTQARQALVDAPLYWLSTVRPDGRPHLTPLVGVWLDGALYFSTGADERKARNLARNRHCSLTIGNSTLDDGVDIVVEGRAAMVGDEAALRSIADTFEAKYRERFTAPTGTWFGLGDAMRRGEVQVYQVVPSKAFGFGKGTSFSQTRWSFLSPDTDADRLHRPGSEYV